MRLSINGLASPSPTEGAKASFFILTPDELAHSFQDVDWFCCVSQFELRVSLDISLADVDTRPCTDGEGSSSKVQPTLKTNQADSVAVAQSCREILAMIVC